MAECTSEITAYRAKREDLSAWQEVEQGFFFDWIDVYGGWTGVGEKKKFAFDVFSDAANAGVIWLDMAIMGTGGAFNKIRSKFLVKGRAVH
ncbi:MAG: hypothetical protein UV19_C0003G0014 [Parcubacteria group bacterium GW2011_GWA2_42_28]|nr:MAG: hypothetical protein UV19_C0003G0014 [Parcubacteria group bacterium GW2011_GWA2_42_28]KKT55833.1 MAG: hypothetical protein UW45_C0004G0014 [Parcubacteria group bacterium GW2011_GWC2_44_22]